MSCRTGMSALLGTCTVLGKEEELEPMKSHPDVGTDSSCISALPCNSCFCCSVGSGTVFTARTSCCTLAGTLGLQQSVFTVMFPQHKQRVC